MVGFTCSIYNFIIIIIDVVVLQPLQSKTLVMTEKSKGQNVLTVKINKSGEFKMTNDHKMIS